MNVVIWGILVDNSPLHRVDPRNTTLSLVKTERGVQLACIRVARITGEMQTLCARSARDSSRLDQERSSDARFPSAWDHAEVREIPLSWRIGLGLLDDGEPHEFSFPLCNDPAVRGTRQGAEVTAEGVDRAPPRGEFWAVHRVDVRLVEKCHQGMAIVWGGVEGVVRSNRCRHIPGCRAQGRDHENHRGKWSHSSRFEPASILVRVGGSHGEDDAGRFFCVKEIGRRADDLTDQCR